MFKNKNGESVMNTIVKARMFVNKEKDQAKYFTNFNKQDLNLYLKLKCEKKFGILFTQKNWEKLQNFKWKMQYRRISNDK